MENSLNKANNGVVYLTFPALTETGAVTHAFSTRIGGVSKGYLGAMNLGYSRGDLRANVDRNYELFCEAIGVEKESCVLTQQTHTTNIRIVTNADRGKGVCRERDYTDIDGLITNEPGVTLVAFGADCIPVWIVDPVRRAIGLAHSGWKGTVGGIAALAVEKMQIAYDCDPRNLVCAVGPGICRNCYEVSREVAEKFPSEVVRLRKTPDGELFRDPETGEAKYDIDLLRANVNLLKRAGVREDNIHVADFCTRCNPKLLFSHRVMGDRRGINAAFLALR